VRTLTALTRTLRELNELLSRHQGGGADACATCDCDMPADPTRSASRWRGGSRRSSLRGSARKKKPRRSPQLLRTTSDRGPHVPPELLTRLNVAVSTFTPGPIVDEIATRLM
jgi:hypothetical protein